MKSLLTWVAAVAAIATLAIGCGKDEEEPAGSGDDVAQEDATAGQDAADGQTTPDEGGDDTAPPPDEGDPPPDEGVDTQTPDVPDAGPPPETGSGLGIDYGATDPGAAPIYDPASGGWSDMGWPNDRYRLPDGTLDLDNFPNPEGSELLTKYLEYGAEALDGWGLNGGVYFRFEASLDLGSLPSVEGSMEPLAAVQLVNVTAGSDRYGEAVPLEFSFYGQGDDPYYGTNTLVMKPVVGMPLAQTETYCAIVTRAVQDDQSRYLQPAPGFPDAILGEPTLQPLLDWIQAGDLHREDVAVASCFTTQNAIAELQKIRDYIKGQPAPVVDFVTEPGVWFEFHGLYTAPNFQAGDKPYGESGGDFQFDASGEPIVQEQETIRFLQLVPRDQEMPTEGWPTIIYAHGTGGDYESCWGVAGEVADRGFVLICIDQPLHGIRGPADGPLSDTEVDLYSFNFTNPRAGRTGFRMAAVDAFTLSHMVASGRFDQTGDQNLAGATIALDPTRIYYFGHSHGGLSGGLALGLDADLQGAVLSGAAGSLIHTILIRKDPADFSLLVRTLLGVPKEAFDAFHPTLALVQMLVDATDHLNYAQLWLNPDMGGGEPKHVFVTQGTSDHASPWIGNNALGAVGTLPIIGPLAKYSLAHELRGLLPTIDEPVSLNKGAGDDARTAAMRQWQDGTHWVAFWNDQARNMWRTFWETIGKGEPPVLAANAELWTYDDAAAGETCAAAGTIDPATLPARLVGNTSIAADDHNDAGCPGGSGAGTNWRDQAFAFVPDVDGYYRFYLWTLPVGEDDPPSGPNLIYIATDCDDVGGTCLGRTVGNVLEVDMTAGTTYYVIVDGTSDLHRGPYELEVWRHCEFVGCGDAQCGWVGCDYCGDCAAGQSCDQGSCVAQPVGERCDDPIVVDGIPYLHVSDSTPYAADYHYESGWCDGYPHKYGQASRDVAYQMTAPSAATYEFRLETDFDGNLYVVSDCGDIANTCLAAHRKSGDGERVYVDLEAGQTVFVIVDGASNIYDRRGPYNLSIDVCVPSCEGKVCGDDGCGGSCGDCEAGTRCIPSVECAEDIVYLCSDVSECADSPQGDRCVDPLVIDQIPFTGQGDTSLAYADFKYSGGQCPGMGKSWGSSPPDVVYAFTPSATDLYKLKLSAAWDSNLYVATDCEDIGNTCLGASQIEKKSGEQLLLNLAADETVYVVVDGASSGSHAGAYTLTVDVCVPSCDNKVCGSDGCGGSCGSCGENETCGGTSCNPKAGWTCTNSRPVNKLPYSHSGDTSTFNVTYANGCEGAAPGTGGASPDVTYRFKPSKTSNYTIQLDASFDAIFYVADNCDDMAGSCLYQGVAGGSIDVELQADVWVYIVVDGAAVDPDSASGSYTLKVWETCYPACDGKSCGGDGCGGSCGTCTPPADICIEGECIDPGATASSSCASALVVGALPFSAEADTSEGYNAYAFGTEQCPGWVGKGLASSDHVWSLTPAEDGPYSVTVFPDGWDAVLYAVTDCGDVAGTCLGAFDGEYPETLRLQLTAGETVYLIVDGASNEVDESGPYEILITSP